MEWNRIACFVLALSTIAMSVALAAPGTSIGVCYGTLGDNLPPPSEVISLLQRCGIIRFRLYDPHPELMETLNSTDKVLISIGVKNEDLAELAVNLDFAKAWVEKNYAHYATYLSIGDIIVGNEVIPGENAKYVVPAMRNIRTAVDETNSSDVFVTTAISSAALENSFPPSQTIFSTDVISYMVDLMEFINSLPNGYQPSVYIHLYPYFAYAADPANVPLDYALFQAKAPVLQDGNLTYWHLYDAMYDSFLWAMEKIGGGNILLEVGETGWPSAGNGNFTTPELAGTYHTNLYTHIVNGSGTPKLPGAETSTAFVFALFNENLKPDGVEQNFGLLYPNMQPVYSTPLCQ